jgi:hypothetical protein
LERALEDPDANAALLSIAHNVYGSPDAEQKGADIATEKMHTIGAWGEAAPRAHVA